MVGTFLSWLRKTVGNLSEKSMEEELDGAIREPVDYEILGNPKHPMFHEMRRRYLAQQTREDRSDTD